MFGQQKGNLKIGGVVIFSKNNLGRRQNGILYADRSKEQRVNEIFAPKKKLKNHLFELVPFRNVYGLVPFFRFH